MSGFNTTKAAESLEQDGAFVQTNYLKEPYVGPAKFVSAEDVTGNSRSGNPVDALDLTYLVTSGEEAGSIFRDRIFPPDADSPYNEIVEALGRKKTQEELEGELATRIVYICSFFAPGENHKESSEHAAKGLSGASNWSQIKKKVVSYLAEVKASEKEDLQIKVLGSGQSATPRLMFPRSYLGFLADGRSAGKLAFSTSEEKRNTQYRIKRAQVPQAVASTAGAPTPDGPMSF